MAWTTLTFPFGSVLTSTKMTQLYDNITAAMNQDSGAPAPGTDFITSATQLAAGVVGNSELASSAVTQGKISTTTTTSIAGSIGTVNSRVDILIGAYAFFPMIHTSGAQLVVGGHSTDGADADAGRMSVSQLATGSYTYDVDWRQISA